MKLFMGMIIGTVVGIAIVVFTYLYVGGFTDNGSNVLGKAQPINPVATSTTGKNPIKAGTSNNSSEKNNKNSIDTNMSIVKSPKGEVISSNSNKANFDQLLKGPYINGIIDGNSPVLISLNHPIIANGVMSLKEYYPMVPSETFDLKVVSPKANQFIMYEYYNGKHTGTYNLMLSGYELSGTFINTEHNIVSQVTLNIYGAAGNYIGSTPFLKGSIGSTPVVICTGNLSTNNMTEFYPSNLKSVFNVTENTEAQGSTDNTIVLDESYHGQETGIYKGKFTSNGAMTGIYTKVSNGEEIPFTLYPSYSN